ncbi:hypothetical protein [Sorangium sp. So ce381]|uniref:hypothetical protein n=1 Tax=Sorangium sp. So ce381 TaxID=3133307 RepID=UPI003F5CA025
MTRSTANYLDTPRIVLGLPLLEQAAAREGSALRDVRLAINHLCRGEARARASGETTFAEFAERVLSGKLAEQYPDHVKAIRTADKYEQRLGHVLDVLGPVPLVRFTLDHADHAMSRLPAHLEPGSRRNIAIVIHRLLALAASTPERSSRNESAGANGRDPSLYPGFWGHQTADRTSSESMDPTWARPPTLELGELAPADSSARVAVVALLAEALTRAVALGDGVAARVVHEAMGRLLGEPPAPGRRASSRR